MSNQPRQGFWREAFALQGSITPKVMPFVLVFGLIASGICGVAWLVEKLFQVPVGLVIAPFEFAGAALGLLLVLRTNAGYDRWWEARKLWGGIVNQSRNLVISAMSYGPANSEWREKVVKWAAVFPHVARLSLRGERPSTEVVNLVGLENAEQIATAGHMPSFVALKLGDLLHEACERLEMDRFAFIQVDRERALLIDHIGACERIVKTPLPRAYSIKIRRFIVMFLLMLPFALLHRLDGDWIVPFITMLVAYPLLSLDQIGVELENPFSTSNLSHLPLDDISATIERNLLDVLKVKQADTIATGRNTAV
ncbi:MAG: bestrophin family ion channel [Nitrospirae bacterium]|nr:bestrophin family ion channel [Nitrospirota bacterium]